MNLKNLTNFELCEMLGDAPAHSPIVNHLDILKEIKARLLDAPEKRMFEVRFKIDGQEVEWIDLPSIKVRGFSPKDACERFADSRIGLSDEIVEYRVNELQSAQGYYFDQGQLA